MKILQDCIQNHATIFLVINILEFAAGLLLYLIPLKKAWQEYFVCVYGGFLIGMIPAFYLTESILCMVGSSAILAVVLCLLQHFYQMKIYLPLIVVLMKMILILGNIFFDEGSYGCTIEFFILAMVLTMLAYISANFVVNPAAIQSHFVLALFGATEIVGSVLQFYWMDYSVFQKELYDMEGTLGFLLYILKVDYSYFDAGYLFGVGLLVALIGYFAWKKIFDGLRKIYQKRMARN